MTLALEPWWSRGTNELVVDSDGWTLRSADGSKTAHSEHTIAITEGAARILTARS
jgi:methionyl aminopeptidase